MNLLNLLLKIRERTRTRPANLNAYLIKLPWLLKIRKLYLSRKENHALVNFKCNKKSLFILSFSHFFLQIEGTYTVFFCFVFFINWFRNSNKSFATEIEEGGDSGSEEGGKSVAGFGSKLTWERKSFSAAAEDSDV